MIFLAVAWGGGLANGTLSLDPTIDDGAKWAFVAFLGGFSAKSLLDKLRGIVDTILGT